MLFDAIPTNQVPIPFTMECEQPSEELIHFESPVEDEWEPSDLSSPIDMSYLYHSLHMELGTPSIFTMNDGCQKKVTIPSNTQRKTQDKQGKPKRKPKHKSTKQERYRIMMQSRINRKKKKLADQALAQRVDELGRMNEELKKTKANLLRKLASLRLKVLDKFAKTYC